MRLWLALPCILLPLSSALAAPTAEAARQIEHLIAFIRESPCAFIRNGNEYEGEAAAGHVRAKYEHFQDEIRSAEDFIDLAASRSALSGRPYQVRCPGRPVGLAADWLQAELKSFRARSGSD